MQRVHLPNLQRYNTENNKNAGRKSRKGSSIWEDDIKGGKKDQGVRMGTVRQI